MTELIFICMVAFITYVFFNVSNEETEKFPRSHSFSKTPPPPLVNAPAPAEPPVVKIEPVVKPDKIPPVINEPLTGKHSVRNPKTGEIATISANYRFLKRWIKEALVEEGLLDKIYSSNELTTELEKHIKTALARLVLMDNYKI